MADFCSCDDGEYPSVFEATDVKAARKMHRCTECRRAILPGESYWHVFGIWPTIDGAATHRTCARCMTLKEFIEAHIPCACLLIGNLLEAVQEEIDNNDEAEVLRDEVSALLADIRAQPAYSIPSEGHAR
jgi:hypothetical protein